MQLVRSSIIICPECQMKLLFPDIVWLRMIPEPGQFQLKLALFIPYIHDDERAILGCKTAFFLQSKRLIVKRQRTVKIGYIVVFMNHFKFHKIFLLYYNS